MKKNSTQENNISPQFEDKTRKSNEEEKPLEFTELKELYDNTLQQFIELLQQIDPEITTKLLHASPEKFLSREAQAKPGSQKSPQSSYQAKVPQGKEVSPSYSHGPSQQQIPLGTEEVPEGHSQSPHQTRSPPGQGVAPAYSQDPSQQQIPPRNEVSTGRSQSPHQTRSPPGQGVAPSYSQDPFQQQIPPENEVSTGRSQSPYQTRSQQGQGVPPAHPHGPPHQPQMPIDQRQQNYSGQGQTTPPQHPQSSRQSPSPVSQGYSVHQIYPPGQPQYSPQQVGPQTPPSITPSPANANVSTDAFSPRGQYPSTTRPANLGLSPSPGQGQNIPSGYPQEPYQPQSSLHPGPRGPQDPSPRSSPQKSRSPGPTSKPPEIHKLEGEVLKSLEDINDQINVILTKFEQK